MSDPGTKIFRVVWEQRMKLACHACCTEKAHPWIEHTEAAADVKQAEKRSDRLYDYDDESAYEVRNVHVEYAETTEWSAYNSWEHKEDSK